MKKYVTLRLVLYAVMLLATSAALVYQVRRARFARPMVEEVAKPRDWTDIVTHSPLVIATDYGATSSRHDVKELEYVYRLSQLITRRTGIAVEVRLEPRLDHLLDSVDAGRIDLLAGHLPRTSQIDTLRFGWVRSIITDPVLLVQRRDTASLIGSQLDLSGKTIALPRGSAYKLFVDHLSDEIGSEIYTAEYDEVDTDSLMHLVEVGTIDFTLCPSSRARYYTKIYPALDISLPITYTLRSGWVLSIHAPVLHDSLSLWIKSVR